MDELRDYITQSITQGLKKPEIEANLIKAGWTKDQIDTIFYSLEFSQKEFIESHGDKIFPFKKIANLLLIFIVFCSILAILFLLAKYLIRPRPSIIATLRIKGDQICVVKTNRAINLLKVMAPDHYADLAKYVNLIQCDKYISHTLFSVSRNADLKKFFVDESTLNAEPIWYASAIVHEACHARQFQNLEANKASYSQEELEREKAKDFEAECYLVQADALKKLGADQRTLDYVKNLH